MGRGTNYVKKPTMLDACYLAFKLFDHTNKILLNENVFDPTKDFHGRLLLKIYDKAIDIASKAFEANEIVVGDNPVLARERLALQVFAIAECSLLMALEREAKILFPKVNSNKFKYWANKTREVKEKLRSWHEGDVRRYGRIAAVKEDFADQHAVGENGCRLESSLGGQLPLAFR